MQTKLHINLTQGIIDVEGDVELVYAVYEDFKKRLGEYSAPALPPAEQPAAPAASIDGSAAAKPKRRKASRKKGIAAENSDAGVDPNNPKFDKSLDTSNLQTFYNQFEPANVPEKILIFLMYLVEKVGIDKPDTDQVFTCFRGQKETVPVAYRQAFYDAASKKGFIQFNSATDIQITVMGENFFNHDLKKKTTE